MAVRKQVKSEVSIRAYAGMIGVDEKTVRKARDAGLLGKGHNKKTGKIIPNAADKAWGNEHKVIKAKPGVSMVKTIEKMEKQEPLPVSAVTDDPEDDEEEAFLDENVSTEELLARLKLTPGMKASEAMRINLIIDAAVNKKKLEETEGKLVSREKVEKAFFAIGVELKKALFNMPQKVVRRIKDTGTEVEGIAILADAITQILSDYGNLKTNSLN